MVWWLYKHLQAREMFRMYMCIKDVPLFSHLLNLTISRDMLLETRKHTSTRLNIGIVNVAIIRMIETRTLKNRCRELKMLERRAAPKKGNAAETN